MESGKRKQRSFYGETRAEVADASTRLFETKRRDFLSRSSARRSGNS